MPRIPAACVGAVALAVALLLAACGDGGPPAVGTAATAEADDDVPTALTAQLAGPDADGSGTATVTLETARGEVCLLLTVDGVAEPTAARLQEAPAGEDGPVVLALALPAGTEPGCATADATLLGRLETAPARFYVNVLNDEFPAGALRGQLG